MKTLVLATALVLLAGLALVAAPVAAADDTDIWCDRPYVGVDLGSVQACCDFSQDPSPCYFRPL